MSEPAVHPRDRDGAAPRWLLAVGPLALLGLLLLAIGLLGPGRLLRGDAPPVEALTYQRVVLDPGEIDVTLLNDGPDPVTIAQLMVDEAYWYFEPSPPITLGHLERVTLHVSYPWVHGETHRLRVVSSNGVTFDHEIAVAVATPRASWAFFGLFALVGLYVGVIPVALGLLWFPLLRRIDPRSRDFVLALTVGLLVFLFVDAGHEGLEAAGDLPGSFQGVALLAIAASAAYLAIESFGRWLRQRRRDAPAGWTMALLVAVGIGLHNFGEGLAVGAAYALGETALGTLLIVGFALHNTTEGLAVVAPLGRERVGLGALATLGAVAGVPTIAGAWLGGFVTSDTLAVAFLGLGAGAIAQVVLQIVRSVRGERTLASYLEAGPVAAGLLAGLALMYLTGMVTG